MNHPSSRQSLGAPLIALAIALVAGACEGPLPEDLEPGDQPLSVAGSGLACDQVSQEVDEDGNIIPDRSFEAPTCRDDRRPRVLERIAVHWGIYIDSIETQWRFAGQSRSVVSRAGGNGGFAAQELVLEPGELVVDVQGYGGKYMQSLTFKTNRGRVLHAGGPEVPASRWFSHPAIKALNNGAIAQRGIQRIEGTAGAYIESIRFF